ncbi:hypothetical protein L7F22_059601 [Adiantum nelumboides]|nr:hypothetical protein [Adiantum nelumboides]
MAAKKIGVGVAVTALGVAVLPIAVPAAVAAAGFGAGGITAGTWAAGLMASYGGAVPVGSLCATLQSVGAAGLATSTVVAAEGVAATLGGFAGYCFGRKPKKPSADTQKEEDSADTQKEEHSAADTGEEEEEEEEKEEEALSPSDATATSLVEDHSASLLPYVNYVD